jgi:NADH-quinone oxidoreductase subunit L
MAGLIWWVLLFPIFGVCINGLVLSWMGRDVRRAWSGWVAVAMSALSFAFALWIASSLRSILGGQPYHDEVWDSWIDIGSLSVPLGLRIDPLSVTMMLVITGVGTLIHLFSVGYMADDERFGRYFTYLNLFMFSMLILVLANNYALMFVGWEGVGLCSYLLIGFWFERVSAAQAGKKAFLINRVGDFGFLLGMFALFQLTGSLTFNTGDKTGALDRAADLMHAISPGHPWVTVVCLLFLLAATGKSAQLPLYLWLPDAMEGPTPVSALIHAATMVTAGVYLVARSAPLYSLSPVAQSFVAWIGVLTALFAAIIAVKQYDIKRVLAYSTVSQLGYMFVGVGVGAYATGIFHLITHAFFKALMFLGAGAVMHALEGQLDMRKMGNVKRYMPVTFWTFAVGWWAICGLPLGAGFFSKDAILEAAYEANQVPGYQLIFWLGVVVAGLTAFYMTRMFVTVFLGSERIELGDEGHGGDAQEHGHTNRPDHGHSHAHDHGHSHSGERDAVHGHGSAHVHAEQAVMNWPLILLAVGSALGGILLVNFLPHFLEPVTRGMVPHVEGLTHETAEGTHHAGWSLTSIFTLPTLASLAAAVLGAGLAYWGFGPNKFAQGWPPATERALGALQNAYDGALHLVFVKGGTALAWVLYHVVDVQVIDRLVNLVGAGVAYLADSLRTLQTGYVRNYALVMLAGAVFVVACFMLILQQDIVGKIPMSYWFGGAALAALVVFGIQVLLQRGADRES